MMHCHMLNMSSFPSVLLFVCQRILLQSYKITYYVIFLQNLPWPCTARMPTKKFCLQLVAGTFTRLFSSFVPVHLLSFTCLPESTSSLLTSLFGSSLRQEPNLLSRWIQHLDPCPWLMLTLHTSNSIWYFLRRMSSFLKRGVRLVF